MPLEVPTLATSTYQIIPNPEADNVDLSGLRGAAVHENNISAKNNNTNTRMRMMDEISETDLDNLAELVPAAKDGDSSIPNTNNRTNDLMLQAGMIPEYSAQQKKGLYDMDDYSDEVVVPSNNEDNPADDPTPNTALNESTGVSGQSISTATQTHEVLMPMYLPTFKPATGCTNASDFIVRCFVARLRSGITVVKHGRSRWCKSRLRVLHIHSDGRSLSWKPAEGEPASGKRPPQLDLTTCTEVRHAWSPDPQNPVYTGTPVLRHKCEAANAHKSFALVFAHRTVDITAVTADQCKVLMEGFSALCFRLQVACLHKTKKYARPMPEDDGVSTTASATLTNSSTPKRA